MKKKVIMLKCDRITKNKLRFQFSTLQKPNSSFNSLEIILQKLTKTFKKQPLNLEMSKNNNSSNEFKL